MPVERWTDKEDALYIHDRILLSPKKDEIMPFAATWMGMGLVMSQTEKDKYAASLICKPKNYANELIYKAEIDSNT